MDKVLTFTLTMEWETFLKLSVELPQYLGVHLSYIQN